MEIFYAMYINTPFGGCHYHTQLGQKSSAQLTDHGMNKKFDYKTMINVDGSLQFRNKDGSIQFMFKEDFQTSPDNL